MPRPCGTVFRHIVPIVPIVPPGTAGTGTARNGNGNGNGEMAGMALFCCPRNGGHAGTVAERGQCGTGTVADREQRTGGTLETGTGTGTADRPGTGNGNGGGTGTAGNGAGPGNGAPEQSRRRNTSPAEHGFSSGNKNRVPLPRCSVSALFLFRLCSDKLAGSRGSHSSGR